MKKYVEKRSQDKAFGLVGQSFTAALQQELTEYYRLLAVLEAQVNVYSSAVCSRSRPQTLTSFDYKCNLGNYSDLFLKPHFVFECHVIFVHNWIAIYDPEDYL